MTALNPAVANIVWDSSFWMGVRAGVLKAVTPILTEFYMGGVLFGVLALRAVEADKALAGAKEDDPDFVALTVDPAFATKAAMFMTMAADSWWQALDGATRRELGSIFTRAYDDGATFPQMEKQVRTLFGKERAARIVATESTRLFGAGAQASYEAALVQWWDWNTVQDGRVDVQCDNMAAGGPYQMAAPFVPMHVSCRCWPVPNLEGPKVGEVPRDIPLMRDKPLGLPASVPSGSRAFDMLPARERSTRALNRWGYDVDDDLAREMRAAVMDMTDTPRGGAERWRASMERASEPIATPGAASAAAKRSAGNAYLTNQKALGDKLGVGLEDEITLYRGVQLTAEQVAAVRTKIAANGFAEIETNALSSWADNRMSASGYGNVVLEARFPRSQSYFSHHASVEGGPVLPPGEHIVFLPSRRVRITADSFTEVR